MNPLIVWLFHVLVYDCCMWYVLPSYVRCTDLVNAYIKTLSLQLWVMVHNHALRTFLIRLFILHYPSLSSPSDRLNLYTNLGLRFVQGVLSGHLSWRTGYRRFEPQWIFVLAERGTWRTLTTVVDECLLCLLCYPSNKLFFQRLEPPSKAKGSAIQFPKCIYNPFFVYNL
jgi:hypothetical protein